MEMRSRQHWLPDEFTSCTPVGSLPEAFGAGSPRRPLRLRACWHRGFFRLTTPLTSSPIAAERLRLSGRANWDPDGLLPPELAMAYWRAMCHLLCCVVGCPLLRSIPRPTGSRAPRRGPLPSSGPLSISCTLSLRGSSLSTSSLASSMPSRTLRSIAKGPRGGSRQPTSSAP